MPRVNYVKAAKDYPDSDIKKGEFYYWWKFRFGGKYRSKTRPRASQLTQSEFLSTMYDLQDRHAAIELNDLDSAVAELRNIAEEVREQGEECNDRKENMPEGLQQGSTGELLEERYEQCDIIADELETAADELEQFAEDDGFEKPLEETELKTQSILEGIGWDFN